MAFTTVAPWAIGDATKKDYFDVLLANDQYQLIEHDTDGTHGAITPSFVNGALVSPAGGSLWAQVSPALFTAAPASTSTITMLSDLTSSIKVGMSLKYDIGGVSYYGQVAAIAANLLTVRGAPLGGSVTALYYGGGIVHQLHILIPGLYEDASNTALISTDLKSNLPWNFKVGYAVYFSMWSKTHDTGTHGQASVRINGVELCTTAGGLTIAADATLYETVVDIATGAYDINPGELIEVTSIKAGNGDASDLTCELIIIEP
jgi:hypothetical protein